MGSAGRVDFRPPRKGVSARGGDISPDFGSPPTGPSRGKYPADGAGPPETKVGRGGPQGRADDVGAGRAPKGQLPKPAKSPRANTSRPF